MTMTPMSLDRDTPLGGTKMMPEALSQGAHRPTLHDYGLIFTGPTP